MSFFSVTKISVDVRELVGFELKNNKAETLKHNLYLQNAQKQIFSESY